MSEPDESVSSVETPIAPDSGDEEHGVIAHFRLVDDGFGAADQRALIYEAEQAIAAATEEADVGEVDGNEFGGGKAVKFPRDRGQRMVTLRGRGLVPSGPWSRPG
ncbi:hypothetical protein [Streptomyces sp. NPDC092129]|uniref:hypothetical protein n=1 Tax=Streptomyces sp. NPDC092129 TaxID=3366010 RepID=UPI0037FD3EC1